MTDLSSNDIIFWSNWTQTPFKYRKFLKNWNRNRFVKFHLRFFKYQEPAFLFDYEVGAKLALYALHNASLRESKALKALRIYLACQDIKNNPTRLNNRECIQMIKMNSGETKWERYKPYLLSQAQTDTELSEDALKYINIIQNESLTFLETQKLVLKFMRSFWRDDKTLKFYLKIIYADMYPYNKTYKPASTYYSLQNLSTST